MKLSRFLFYVLLASWLNLAFASTTTNSAEYKPKVGQEAFGDAAELWRHSEDWVSHNRSF